jgi:membrane protease YdiL (CAAX protease family)
MYVLIGLLIATPLAMWISRLSPALAGWRLGGWPTFFLGIGWGVVLSAGVAAWMWLLLPHDGLLADASYLPLATVVRPVDWAVLVLAAPVAEEIFLRGVLLGGMQRNWSPFWAVVLCATFDVILHFTQPWIAVHFAVAIGYALAFRWSGSVVAPILAHMMAVSALLLSRMYPAGLYQFSPQTLLLAAGGGVLLIIVGGIGRRHSK